MVEVDDLVRSGNAAVVAPAGHGKTEVIAKVAAKGERALILTHTHAGVHAIRMRLKRLQVPYSKVAVDTIAGWSMRYGNAFPGVADPPEGMPQGAGWDRLYEGATAALRVSAVREVVAASYDRVLIDEYQDCGRLQHGLAVELSSIVPTIIFGDPMQGIFEFAGATLNWDEDIYPTFPLAGTLDFPHRWSNKNPELGQWIAETREKLLRGDAIDLNDPRITYRVSGDAFDMATLFEGIDQKVGTFAAIHCKKGICYSLAKASNAGYQAIEEIAANRLRTFSDSWDGAANGRERLRALKAVVEECSKIIDGDVTAEETSVEESMQALAQFLDDNNGADAAVKFLALARQHPRRRVHRNELWRDCQRALDSLAAGRCESMSAATTHVRQRVSMSGRNLPLRTVSTPLLLKGLEFDHVVIPLATHFLREDRAQAKLFYVAISRAIRSLVVSSPETVVTFPRP